MAFSNQTIQDAWKRANGRCECKRSSCGHTYRCNRPLVFGQRGNNKSVSGWEAHHILSVAAGGKDYLSNCEILCIECHIKTRSYGN